MTVQITHTHEEGTLIEGTTRAMAAVCKAHRLRWWRDGTCWYVPRSRDTNADTRRLDAFAADLRETHDVAVTIESDDTPRPIAEQEEDRADRAQARAARLATNAAKAHDLADGHYQRARTIGDMIPMGQPILVGHHSERRHRRDLDRMDKAMRASIDESRRAGELDRAARIAARATDARYNPVTVANRIQRLEAEARQAERDNRSERAEQLRKEAAHWHQVRADQVDVGETPDIGPDDVDKGDQVKWRDTWYPVLRVNKKSVTVPSIVGGSWTDTIEYPKLVDVRKAQQAMQTDQ